MSENFHQLITECIFQFVEKCKQYIMELKNVFEGLAAASLTDGVNISRANIYSVINASNIARNLLDK
jgi:hypothetical protein